VRMRGIPGFCFQRIDEQCEALWRDFLRHLGDGVRWIRSEEGFQPGLHVIVAVREEDHRVVGHICLLERVIEIPSSPPTKVAHHGEELEEMFVQTFGVDEEYRGHGIGKRLQEEAFQFTKDRHCYQMRSWSSLGKDENYNLKLSLRFGVHPGFEYHPERPDPFIYGAYFVLPTGILPGEPKLPNHDVVLEDGEVRLRPLAEEDWPALLRWNRDPEVLWWCEGDDVKERRDEDTKGICRRMASWGHLFIIESPPGEPVGEMCVQRMNIPRRLVPGKRLFRLPITIGEKEKWGQGIGKRAVRLALRFAFEDLDADMVCAMDVDSHNRRSVNLWKSLGFSVVASYPSPESKHGPDSESIDFAIEREKWLKSQPDT
jgi:RimJ/RimL family protein N-acetyltransferase